MLGAITGDIIGSVYEGTYSKPDYDFQLITRYNHFTDDTVLTVALADSILSDLSYSQKLQEYYFLYPNAGYGGYYHKWARSKNPQPYNSWGNGSAMRVSPIGWAYDDIEKVLIKAKESAEVTHNHLEGIKGAQAAAVSIFLAKRGSSKQDIKEYIEKNFQYSLNMDLTDLRINYGFDVSCQGTVPQAIYTFLISNSFEDSIRKAIYIGGDSDTLAAINGSIAEAFYGGVPRNILQEIYLRLDKRLLDVSTKFIEQYMNDIYKGSVI